MRTTALKQVSEHGGPMVLGAGMTLLAVALVTSTTHGGITAAQPPSHATTAPVTAPPASTTPAKPARPRTSTTAPHAEPTGGQVVVASAPRPGSGTRRPSGIAPSGPAPRPPATTAPSTTSRCDIGVTALTINACLRLGGTP